MANAGPQWVAVGAPELQMVLAVAWPLRSFLLTVNLQDAEMFQFFDAGCVGEGNFQHLHLEALYSKHHATASA